MLYWEQDSHKCMGPTGLGFPSVVRHIENGTPTFFEFISKVGEGVVCARKVNRMKLPGVLKSISNSR